MSYSISNRSSLLTPNIHEAARIAGFPVLDLDDMKRAAQEIFSRYRMPNLITGGHLDEEASDLLFDGRDFHLFSHERMEIEVHGTGCFLSSSVLAYLCQGKKLEQACRMAVDLTLQGIKSSVPVGGGQRLFSFRYA